MSLTQTEAEQLIRMELRQWGFPADSFEWVESGGMIACAVGSEQRIKLTPRVLNSSALLTEVVKHEIAHLLDYKERGTFEINGRNVFHGKNWKKWCGIVGCRPRRFIPL